MIKLLRMVIMPLMIAMASVAISCGGDDDNRLDDGIIDIDNSSSSSYNYNSTVEKLKGTSWKWVKNDWYRNGSFYMTNDGDNSVITFSEEKANGSSFYMYVNGNKAGFWYPNSVGIGSFVSWNSTNDWTKYGNMSEIYKLTSSELVTGTDVKWHYFVKVSSYTGGGSGGPSADYAPSFRDFSYTYTSNSITVQFLTEGNNTTSATVYYGMSTSPSTSVSTSVSGGHIISARITGLSKATKYYVKCVATNSYGSTTSNVMPVMTGSN